MIVAPNSPRPRANASASPAASPPRASGSTTRKNVRAGPAPSVRDAATSVRVDGLEGRDRLADVERARHERDGEHDRGLRERDERSSRAEQARRGRTRRAARCPATAGGSTSGSSTSVTTSAAPAEAPGREQVRRAACRTGGSAPARSRVVFEADDERVGHDRVRQLVRAACPAARAGRSPRPAARGTRARRRRRQHERASGRTADAHRSTRGRKPARQQDLLAAPAAARVGRTPAPPACCRWPTTTQIPYCTYGCARRDLEHPHLLRHGARVGRVDEARVGLAERDLRQHLAHVGLLG